MNSGNLNFLERSGPLQACNGTALPFLLYWNGENWRVSPVSDGLSVQYQGLVAFESEADMELRGRVKRKLEKCDKNSKQSSIVL